MSTKESIDEEPSASFRVFLTDKEYEREDTDQEITSEVTRMKCQGYAAKEEEYNELVEPAINSNQEVNDVIDKNIFLRIKSKNTLNKIRYKLKIL